MASRGQNSGKLYTTFLLKCGLKCMQQLKLSCLQFPAYNDPKYLFEYHEKKPDPSKQYPIKFSADAGLMIARLHHQIYEELKSLAISSNSSLAAISAESGSTEFSYFEFVYNVVQIYGEKIKAIPGLSDVSDNSCILTNIINVLGSNKASAGGQIADCVYAFNKIIAYMIATQVWYFGNTITQKHLHVIFTNLFMSDMALDNLYIEIPKDDTMKKFLDELKSKSASTADISANVTGANLSATVTTTVPSVAPITVPTAMPTTVSTTAPTIAFNLSETDALLKQLSL